MVAVAKSATVFPKCVSGALALAAGVVCIASVSVLAAGNPGREPYPPGPDLSINCPQGYVGVLQTTIDKEYIKTFTSADGTVTYKVEGRLVETWTGNGKSLPINNSGPGTVTVRPDGSVMVVTEGLTMFIPRALDGLWIYTGQLKIDLDTGVISHHGAVRDLCALLS
jgi:hypothetical protein